MVHSKKSVLFYAQTNILQKRATADNVYLHQTKQCEHVANLNDLCNFCQKYIQYKDSIDRGTYKIHLWFDTIINWSYDDPKMSPRKFRIEGDRFSFMVSTTNKLLYIEDAIKLFNNSDILQLDDRYILHPLCVQNFDGQKIKLRPLNDKDIVVDQNLQQIWPIQTNEPPTQLVKMLTNQTIQGVTR